MSYVRFGGNSDVYVYPDAALDGITCCACSLNENEDLNCQTHGAMIEHLHQHRMSGQLVPDYAFEHLEAEAQDG